MLLDEHPISIDTVARNCGFTDAGYFATAFRQKYGVSPRAWRKARRDQVATG
jgi:AraC-like DNA-binding protein